MSIQPCEGTQTTPRMPLIIKYILSRNNYQRRLYHNYKYKSYCGALWFKYSLTDGHLTERCLFLNCGLVSVSSDVSYDSWQYWPG